jgi:leader peptidase (prepilin peptidase)/N-methyltransferase
LGIFIGGGLLYAVAVVFYWVTKKEGMGGGDIKLLAMIGAFLGWSSTVFTIVISSLIGSIAGVALMVAKGADSKYAIPFGPFLSMGAVIYLFFGREIIRWYLHFRV